MAEILTTLALHDRMHVIDRATPGTGEHVLTGEPVRVGDGQYAVPLDGRTPVIVGARHSWLVAS